MIPPPGAHGGEAGLPGRKFRNLGQPTEERLNSKAANVQLAKDDIVSFVTPGSGGFGAPIERKPEDVLIDVLDGKISREAARRFYGVVVDEAKRCVDQAETNRLRANKVRVDVA
jgi:N-methylhydantoinase B